MISIQTFGSKLAKPVSGVRVIQFYHRDIRFRPGHFDGK